MAHLYAQGEVSALINIARVLGGMLVLLMITWDVIYLFRFVDLGFSVAYFQVPWAARRGALQVFGVEAAYVFETMLPIIPHALFDISIVTGVFLLVVPYIQMNGRNLRVRCWSFPPRPFER